jgi:beta-1,4-mannooligosaccharide/beta-1,4-mannosyl-N-acetylglucosamine phosphorylase
MLPIIGDLVSSPVITRHPANPVLTANDVPNSAALVFNPGVTKYEGRYVMAFRNDYGSVLGCVLVDSESSERTR